MPFGLFISDSGFNPPSFTYFYNSARGAAFPTAGPLSPVDAESGWAQTSTFTGPFFSGDKKAVILQVICNPSGTGAYENYPNAVQAWVASGGSDDFVRMDQTHEPQIRKDAHLGAFNSPIGSVQNPKKPDLIYTAYLKSDGSSGSTRLALRVFDLSTGLWGPDITSSLDFPISFFSGLGGLIPMMGYRAGDDCVIFGSNQYDNSANKSRCSFARCFVTGAGWDSSWTHVGDTSNSTDSWVSWAGGMDPSDNMHFFMVRVVVNAESMYHQVLHPDGSLSALQLVDQSLGLYSANGQFSPSMAFTPQGMVIANFSALLVSDAISDSPQWFVVPVFPAVRSGNGIAAFYADGKLQAFAADFLGNVFQSSEPFDKVVTLGNMAALGGGTFTTLFGAALPALPDGSAGGAFWRDSEALFLLALLGGGAFDEQIHSA